MALQETRAWRASSEWIMMSTGKDVENWVIFVAAGNVKRGGHFRGFYCFLKDLNA